MTTEAWLILLSSVILLLVTGGGLWLRYVAGQLKSKDTAIQALKGVVKLKDAQIASLQGDTPTITKAYTTMRDNIEQVTQEGQPLTEQLAELTSEQQLSKHLLPAKETNRASGVWSRFKPAKTRQGKIALGIFGTIVLIVVSIVMRVVSQADAPDFNEASKRSSAIQAKLIMPSTARQKAEEDRDALLAKAERDRLRHQSIEESREQMRRNVLGKAHDTYNCRSNGSNAEVTFDYGSHWWDDDGQRCFGFAAEQAAEQAAERAAEQAAERAVEQQGKAERQKARDADAELSSYWPTTLRVDTDMDSFWLVNEERRCKTYPNNEGRVVAVFCNASTSQKDHRNIPVKFWGGVDRNTVSEWKCRRESEQFVCRAIN